MDKIKPGPRKLHLANSCRRSRLFHPPLISLLYAALVWTLSALGLVFPPPPGGGDRGDRDAADLDGLTGGQPAAKRLDAAELDERAPLSPQEAAQFGPGKRHRTARRIYQATLLLTQGGARERYMSDLAALVGVCRRTVQRAHDLFEELGLSARRHRKTGPAWNLPNLFRFLLRERQLRFFLKNVTQGRKNLKQETTTPKNPAQERGGMWKSCRSRPENHPPEVRAAWERRRRANHPPEMRQKFEERAAMWKHMRGWRPTAAQKNERLLVLASRVAVGVHFDSEELRVVAMLTCAVRLGMSKRAAARIERDWYVDRIHRLAEPEPDELPTITEGGPGSVWERKRAAMLGWEDITGQNQAPELGPEMSAIVGPGCDPGESKLPPPVLTQAAELPQAEPAAAIDEPQGEPATAAECPLCEGRRRRVLGGRIVVCSCSPESWAKIF